MTIGIYALYWEEQDLIYVGQSQNIENRFLNHLSSMKSNTHTNYKVQNAFNNYNEPKLIILEECNLEIINDREIYWQKEFNSLNSLDIIEAGQVGFGISSNASKYSKLQVLRVFKLLASKQCYNYNKLEELTGIKAASISDIALGKSHFWLKNKYPRIFKRIVLNIKIRTSNNRSLQTQTNYTKPIVISPEGIEHQVLNISQFSREHNLLRPHLSEVIAGKRKYHKGWYLKI